MTASQADTVDCIPRIERGLWVMKRTSAFAAAFLIADASMAVFGAGPAGAEETVTRSAKTGGRVVAGSNPVSPARSEAVSGHPGAAFLLSDRNC